MPEISKENALKWQLVLKELESSQPQQSFDTWIKPLQVIDIFDDKFVLECQDPVGLNSMRTRYYAAMHNAIEKVFGRDYTLIFVQHGDKLPPEAMRSAANPPNLTLQNSQLNPKYTFDTFVVGASNRFAHAACLAVAETPAESYNPLFLYGGVGLGKTHLMHAIGHFVLQTNPSAKILYITSENFTNELIDSIRKNNQQDFRDKLRNVDILMVDDIQFIAGKNATQEEFFHTFNHLHGAGKQIIMSSDRPPKDIPTLEDRLRSRFEWGLIADIQKPDFETRSAILRKKAEEDHMEVPDEIIQYIAENADSNIRELEGFLTRVTANATLEHKQLTLAYAQQTLSGVIHSHEVHRLTPELIIDIICNQYNVDKKALESSKRNREIALPRQICMYFLREIAELSTTRIGALFGDRDHTTVMHACDKIQADIKESPQFARQIQELREKIHGK